jgi:hypothetical protein
MEGKGEYPKLLLEELHASRFIRFLADHQEARTYQLLAVTGNYHKIKELGEKLKDAGLVNVEVEEKPRLTFINTSSPPRAGRSLRS